MASSSFQQSSVSPDAVIHLNRALQELPISFLEQAISSHLQTCCCSVVLGKTVEQINMVIQVLVLFLKQTDKKCILLANPSLPQAYQTGLLVQGILKDSSGHVQMNAQEVLCNPLPTTIVDCIQLKVRQTPLLPRYLVLHNRALQYEVETLTMPKETVSTVTESVFSSCHLSSSMVKTFLQEISSVANNPVLQVCLLDQFMHQLQWKAYTLVKVLQTSPSADKAEWQQFSGRQLQQQLALDKDDFLIVVAIAERLKPGLPLFINLYN